MTDIITKLDGTTISRADKVLKMINWYQEKYYNKETKLCDLSIGSELRTLLESFTVETSDVESNSYDLFKQTFLQYSTGNYLDMKSCEQKINRKKGSVAKGEVTFSIPNLLNDDYIIPAGVIILNRDNGNEYILSSDVVIAAGTYSANGFVYAKVIGSASNAISDKLTAFKNIHRVRYDLKVTNNSEITGGTDPETDESLRQRCFDSKKEKAFGTLPSYSNNILEYCYDVHDVAFINPNNLSNHYKVEKDANNNNVNVKCTDCMRVVIVNANSKPCPTEVLQEVETYISNQNNKILGHTFHVQKATLSNFIFDVGIFPNGSVTEDDIITAMLAYINGGTIGTRTYPGLKIGEAVRKQSLMDAIEELDNVDQVESITAINYNNSLPSDVSQWTKVGNQQYTYTKGNYTYSRSGDTINKWGKANFVTLSPGISSVASLGYKRNVDTSTRERIGLTIY